jgi:hypothetical protein
MSFKKQGAYEAQSEAQLMNMLSRKSPRQAGLMYQRYLNNEGTHPDTIKAFSEIKAKNPRMFDFSAPVKRYDYTSDGGQDRPVKRYDHTGNGNGSPYGYGNAQPARSKDGRWKSDMTGLWLKRDNWTKADYAAERKLAQVSDGYREAYVNKIISDPETPLEKVDAFIRVKDEFEKYGVSISPAKAEFQKRQFNEWMVGKGFVSADKIPAPRRFNKSGGYKSDITKLSLPRDGWGKEEYAAERKLVQIEDSKRGSYIKAMAKDPSTPKEKVRAFVKVNTEMNRYAVSISPVTAAYNRGRYDGWMSRRQDNRD